MRSPPTPTPTLPPGDFDDPWPSAQGDDRGGGAESCRSTAVGTPPQGRPHRPRALGVEPSLKPLEVAQRRTRPERRLPTPGGRCMPRRRAGGGGGAAVANARSPTPWTGGGRADVRLSPPPSAPPLMCSISYHWPLDGSLHDDQRRPRHRRRWHRRAAWKRCGITWAHPASPPPSRAPPAAAAAATHRSCRRRSVACRSTPWSVTVGAPRFQHL